MKKLLSLIFIATNATTAGQLLTKQHTTSIAPQAGSFKTIASKTYADEGKNIDGVEAIAKTNDKFYGVVVEGDNIAFYQIVNNKMNLLTTLPITHSLQIGSGTATVVKNCIYYEFLIKTDQYNVGSGQYFKLNLTTNKVTVLGEHQLVPPTNRYTYENDGVKSYIYF